MKKILSDIQLPDSDNLVYAYRNFRFKPDLSVGIVVPAFVAEEFLDDRLKSIANSHMANGDATSLMMHPQIGHLKC